MPICPLSITVLGIGLHTKNSNDGSKFSTTMLGSSFLVDSLQGTIIERENMCKAVERHKQRRTQGL